MILKIGLENAITAPATAAEILSARRIYKIVTVRSQLGNRLPRVHERFSIES
jgi:hypothetical protein